MYKDQIKTIEVQKHNYIYSAHYSQIIALSIITEEALAQNKILPLK